MYTGLLGSFLALMRCINSQLTCLLTDYLLTYRLHWFLVLFLCVRVLSELLRNSSTAAMGQPQVCTNLKEHAMSRGVVLYALWTAIINLYDIREVNRRASGYTRPIFLLFFGDWSPVTMQSVSWFDRTILSSIPVTTIDLLLSRCTIFWWLRIFLKISKRLTKGCLLSICSLCFMVAQIDFAAITMAGTTMLPMSQYSGFSQR